MDKNIFFVMGVSGSGKSTVGKLLGKKLAIPFYDGDDFHPKENLVKMQSGQPLNDNDRKQWLKRLNELALEHKFNGAVIACSALKKKYRELLADTIEKNVEFVYLKGSFDEIEARLKQRKGHFMPSSLLKSQFETLEEPEKSITVSITSTPDKILQRILKKHGRT